MDARIVYLKHTLETRHCERSAANHAWGLPSHMDCQVAALLAMTVLESAASSTAVPVKSTSLRPSQ